MAGCNDNCNCFLSADAGIEIDGLGSADTPYVVTTAAGFHIPEAGTASERAALVVTDADQGKAFYETDTGLVYVYEGSAYGWVAQSVQAMESVAASTTLSQAVTDYQEICSLTLGPGRWAITAKANIEASISVGTGWDAILNNDTAAAELDRINLAVSGSEVPSGAMTYWRPFPLQDLASLAVASAVSMRVRRATTGGTQLVKNAKLMAWSIPGTR